MDKRRIGVARRGFVFLARPERRHIGVRRRNAADDVRRNRQDQLGFGVGLVGAGKERAQNRYVPKNRNRLFAVVLVVLDEPADDARLPILEAQDGVKITRIDVDDRRSRAHVSGGTGSADFQTELDAYVIVQLDSRLGVHFYADIDILDIDTGPAADR